MNTVTENSIIKKDGSKSGTQSYAKLLKAIVMGTVIAMLISVLLLLVFAIIINSIFGDPDSVITTFIVVAASLGALIGGFYASRSNGGKGLLCGVSTGMAMSIILFLAMILRNTMGSESASVKFRLVTVIFQIIFACIGGIVAVNTHKSTKTTHYSLSKKK